MSYRRLDWSKVEHLWGEVCDLAIAAELGCTVNTVRLHRKAKGIAPLGRRQTAEAWASVEPMMGKMPDAEVADVLGVTRQAVTYQRKKRGIAPWEDIAPLGRRQTAEAWASVEPMMGKMPDAEVADVLGVTRRAVAYQRKKRGIAPWEGAA